GVDASFLQLRAAKERGLQVAVMDGHSLGFKRRFDAVFTNEPVEKLDLAATNRSSNFSLPVVVIAIVDNSSNPQRWPSNSVSPPLNRSHVRNLLDVMHQTEQLPLCVNLLLAP